MLGTVLNSNDIQDAKFECTCVSLLMTAAVIVRVHAVA